MKTTTATLLALSLAVGTGIGAAQAQEPMNEQTVRSTLTAQGYTGVHDIEYKGGLWKADARSADGKRLEVSIDPATGKLYPSTAVATLGAQDIRARLDAAGYTRVRDVEFDDGLWEAEAVDPQGRKVELKLDPESGEVIGSKRD
ncbi:PepSY domain-containing protein [Lysobacter sp. GX 14042]|uniref:PepSY domain-containing protein n=1 Tax=Lysobacter sp. GX 14042 TaxID=2907155 RepID=UPI001F2469C4|nr:PepSY domain-containing protein [Lysobacter sp. GX 14042]MCE7033041.1 PepSY domain-containing protein [Lysobacter sp. GX 14042]